MSDIMKWEPFKDIARVFEEMDKMFAPLFESLSEEIHKSPLLSHAMDLQVREENGEIVVSGHIPEHIKDNLDVVVHQNKVTIRGEGAQTKDQGGAKQYQWGSFTSVYHLPAKVRSEKARVNIENGLLRIRAPKEK